MLRKIAHATAPVVAVAALAGCCLFPPRPTPVERSVHVVIVALDGLKPADIDPQRTPHLYLVQHDGAYTWDLNTRAPGDRVGMYSEALTGLPKSMHTRESRLEESRRSILTRCRAAGLGAVSLIRSHELTVFDPQATYLPDVSAELDNPVALGSYAASEFLRCRPECMFVELSAGKDPITDCDTGLGKLFAAINGAGLAGQTTLIVISAGPPRPCWMVRGPGTRHGHQLPGPVSAADTLATAAKLLHLPAEDAVGRPVTGAFRAWSDQPISEGERIVPRGSIRGQVLQPDGSPMPRASVLLVNDEPPDGITEHWADANNQGNFRFDSIPATRYDYVFVFDNLPGRLRGSLLVRRGLEVKRDVTAPLKLIYTRIQGSDKNAADVPAAERVAAFLDDEQVEILARSCQTGAHLPLLAADALSGRRARTSAIRQWLLESARSLQSKLEKGPVNSAVVTEIADFAAAYDMNRASGVLTNTEEREVRAMMIIAAELLTRAYHQKRQPGDSNACLALALTAGALRPSRFSERWLRQADTMFEKRFAAVAQRAERDPASVAPEELCRILQYAMVNRALGCGNYIDQKLERIVKLAAATLTPAQRGVSPASRAVSPDPALGYLGLAKSAFADTEFGEKMQALWEVCRSPIWAPRGPESLVGTLLTAGARPPARPLGRVRSEQLTKTAAVLTKDWGTSAEWFVYLNGWNLDVHVGAARLAKLQTTLLEGRIKSQAHILRFRTSPAYDYALLGGWVSRGENSHLPAYRHILFNKLTGYIVVSDEFPPGLLSLTGAETKRVTGRGGIAGAEGCRAQLLALAAKTHYPQGASSVRLERTATRPTFVI